MAFRHLTNTVHHTVYPAISPSNPSNSAYGKTIIISGGASGIGYSIAQGFSAAGAATVVIIARRQEALDEASTRLRAENTAAGLKTEVWTYLLDITAEENVHSVFKAIRKRLNEGSPADGQPKDADVLVTSAANVVQGKTTLDFSNNTYRDAMETNLYGNLNLTRAFLEPETGAIPLTTLSGDVKETTPSRYPYTQKIILDVSSFSAYAVLPAQATYGVSKLAFTRALQQLQIEVDGLPGSPVRIHSFHPGAVFTPAAKTVVEKKLDGFEWDDESLPGGFAVWLASPAAAFLKGKFVFSNWDVEELVALKKRFEESTEFGTITLSF